MQRAHFSLFIVGKTAPNGASRSQSLQDWQMGNTPNSIFALHLSKFIITNALENQQFTSTLTNNFLVDGIGQQKQDLRENNRAINSFIFFS